MSAAAAATATAAAAAGRAAVGAERATATATAFAAIGDVRFVRVVRLPRVPLMRPTTPTLAETTTATELPPDASGDEKQVTVAPLTERIPWLAKLDMRRVPGSLNLARHEDVEAARAVGMDAASAFVVEALDPQPGDVVLDLCTAPGNKLMAMAELMQRRGRLVGVDVAEHRLNTAASLVRKYGIARQAPDQSDADWYVSLLRADGTRVFSNATSDDVHVVWSTNRERAFFSKHENRKRVDPAMRRQLASVQEPPFPPAFDRVLVDAQCLHDGSFRHEEAAQAYKKPRPDVDEDELRALQVGLIRNGFRLLKPGGTMVYSTCSFDANQNEAVVEDLLRAEPTARLVPVGGHPSAPGAPSTRLPPTLLFSPAVSGTSGMFVSKIEKAAS